MKKIYTLLFCLLVSYAFATSYETKGWKAYLSYNSTTAVEEAADKVFALADGSLFSYGKEDNSLKQYFKGSDINDSEIKFIRYNKKTSSLIIVYSNSNIDLMSDGGVRNIPYLYNNTSLTNKTVNNVYINDDYAFLSTAFGIVVVNMSKGEIKETYNLSSPITSCTINNNEIFATTTDTNLSASSLIKASLKDNLLDPGNWKSYSLPQISSSVTAVVTFNNSVLYQIKDQGIYYEKDGSLVKLVNNPNTQKIKVCGDKFFWISDSMVLIFSSLSSYDQINNISIKDVSTYQTDKFWLAENSKGLRSIKKTASNKFEAASEAIIINGPANNNAYKILCKNDKIYLIPGGKALENGGGFSNYGALSIYEEDKWSIISWDAFYNNLKVDIRDLQSMEVSISQDGSENIYLASQGNGLIHLKDRTSFKQYTQKNSTIQNIYNDNRPFCRIDGLGFDKDGNLWMNNSSVSRGVKVLDKDGNWHSISSYLDQKYTLHNLLITSNNDKWFNIPRPTAEKGIGVISNGSSLDNVTSYFYQSFVDTDNNNFSPSYFTSMAEDKNGYVWVGSSQGVIYFTNPKMAASENNSSLRCTRVKHINDEGEAYYFLDNVMVSCIKIDAGNRKWIGTQGNGVYVLSNNNEEVIHQFNTSNSPLLSDNIYDININDNTGEVFIGTDKGLISYQGEATEGKDNYSDIYAFPNPVRPENEKVTITGLMDNSNVKITDLNGNLIYQTTSIGGQVSWNCRNKSGNRVVSGVYLVLAATQNSAESVVTKIAVIK